MRVFVLALALLALPAHAREWTDDEVAWGTAAAVAHVIDWGQTRYIATHPERFRELNPMIGEHPSVGGVNRYFLASGAFMFAVAHYLPQYRSTLLKVWFTIGVGANLHNAAIGVRISF